MQFKLLAIGVAVAACFTSVVNAASPYEGEGKPLEINTNHNTNDERLFGGWDIDEGDELTDEMKAPLQVTSK